ncbi:MAG: pilus assembly protein PilM [Pirellulales bacterium]|nr:pilus assembly protein PilM [Pirellulales bacterium]
MASSDAVWAIDIGQCSLKALRCLPGAQPDQITADAFDYIAYPKILSQPGVDPAPLVHDALEQFLSRNSVRGDRVAIAVPGQNGLARFIKLPPVESKKIPDIVRYEARQQIPFDLNDVVWDYQQMGGGAEEEGFALETEIGLFAMKREQVFRALAPLREVGIEVDFIQLTPLALYNFLLFDQFSKLGPAEDYDPSNPPASTIILSLGTDATDLVVTNGYRVWQRSIPLGGSHFTKALTKELKLTFAKAEHLKCNAASAQDPKALFQAMRPVFSDLLTQIQRSIGYYNSIERHATFEKIVALGNAMKMPGLRRYLSQSLGMEVKRADSYRGLTGPTVLTAPAFRDNILSFGVCYGLAVQGLGVGKATLKTNLLPPEIVKDRLIRAKKPWALAAAAMLLLGCTIYFASESVSMGTVSKDRFGTAEGRAGSVSRESSRLKSEESAVISDFDNTDLIGQHLIGNVDNRVVWLELLRAINECLPHEDAAKRQEIPYGKRRELHFESIECEKTEQLENWYAGVKPWVQPSDNEKKAEDAATPPADDPYGSADAAQGPTGPTGPGWIVRLTGYHYYNYNFQDPEAGAPKGKGDTRFVNDMFIKALKESTVSLPKATEEKDNAKVAEGQEKPKEVVTMEELGVKYPVLIPMGNGKPYWKAVSVEGDGNGPAMPGGMPPMMGGMPGMPGGDQNKQIQLLRFDFQVEFAWTPTPPTKRLDIKTKAEEAAKNAAENNY